MASTISPLQTPLQSQTCAVSGSSAAVACEASASSASGSSVSRSRAHGVDQQLRAAGVAEQHGAEHAAVGVGHELAVGARGGVGGDHLALALGGPGA